MRPAFRTRQDALFWSLLLLTLLALPLLIDGIGLAPRVEAYKTVGTNAGTIGGVIRDIYGPQTNGDIVFLGSSLVEAGIDREMVSREFPGNVAVLALNWPGLDLQYFLLRDYLERRKVRLVVWNLPEPHSRAYDAPHIQAYRWIRWGEYQEALAGLPLSYRLSLYGEMVLGAPRQVLSRIRPNLEGSEALNVEPRQMFSGYNQAAFVRDAIEHPGVAHSLPPESATVTVVGPAPGAYQMHFARQIASLARQHGCAVVLLHMPIDAEYGQTTVPELDDWAKQLGGGLKLIGIPSAELFAGLDKTRFLHFYRDAHLNQNGAEAFTRAILPALREAYEQAGTR
jgi:hypothetical protein